MEYVGTPGRVKPSTHPHTISGSFTRGRSSSFVRLVVVYEAPLFPCLWVSVCPSSFPDEDGAGKKECHNLGMLAGRDIYKQSSTVCTLCLLSKAQQSILPIREWVSEWGKGWIANVAHTGGGDRQSQPVTISGGGVSNHIEWVDRGTGDEEEEGASQNPK